MGLFCFVFSRFFLRLYRFYYFFLEIQMIFFRFFWFIFYSRNFVFVCCYLLGYLFRIFFLVYLGITRRWLLVFYHFVSRAFFLHCIADRYHLVLEPSPPTLCLSIQPRYRIDRYHDFFNIVRYETVFIAIRYQNTFDHVLSRIICHLDRHQHVLALVGHWVPDRDQYLFH